MNNNLLVMLNKYHPRNHIERENGIKEIIQEIVLAGLSRGGFFSKAAFYGGTCLRIFYGLDRFSEDLDFALLDKEPFHLENYFPYIKKELASYGINMELSFKEKKIDTKIETAFIKGNALSLMMYFFPNSEDSDLAMGDKKIKIKFEIDTANPAGGDTEIKYRFLPSPYEVRVFDEPTLFAGKIAAIICREYKHRVKGRDYYDYLFYCGKGSKYNLNYLENKLKESMKIGRQSHLTAEMVKELLKEKFLHVDYESAKEDVRTFINDFDALKLWSPSLFLSTLDGLEFN